MIQCTCSEADLIEVFFFNYICNATRKLTLGTKVQLAKHWFSTFHLQKLRPKRGRNEEVKIWRRHHVPILTFHCYFFLTFVEASRHVACRRAQQHPEDHGTGHESPSVGWWQETQAGQDYSSRHINELIQTHTQATHGSFIARFILMLSVVGL